MPVTIRRQLYLLLLLGYTSPLRSEKVLGSETEDFDFDGLPGVEHTFTFELSGGVEECFYQKIKSKANVYLNYEITKDQEQQVHFRVISPSANNLLQHMYQSKGHWDYSTTEQGLYSFCFESPEYSFSSMFINFFLSATPTGAWEKYNAELEKMEVNINNFTANIEKTEQNVHAIRWYQSMGEFHYMSDFSNAASSNSYVQTRSVLQCLLILTAAAGQIYFVRRLFNTGSNRFQQRA